MKERDRIAPRLRFLEERARAMAALRGFFAARDFLEVETPLLVPSPGMELHLDAFPVEVRPGGEPWYLITSPEYQLKRLLAAGLPRVYSVARCFRRGEAGAHHNPEFTMVEWYRAPGGWREIAEDVVALCHAVVSSVQGPTPSYRGRPLDLSPSAWRWLTVGEAMDRFAGVRCDGDEPAAELRARGLAAGVPISEATRAWDDVFFAIFLHAVEPRLAEAPTILYDWPRPLAALARLSPDDPRKAERFEAYACGLELANGFGELVDGAEQRARFEHEQAERRARGLPVYPIDERLLAALADLPPSAGVALGVDRLVLLAASAPTIRDVLTFPVDEL